MPACNMLTHMLTGSRCFALEFSMAVREAGKQLILVLAGSLNPPTFMHLRLLETARDIARPQFSRVIGLLSPVNDSYNKPELLPAVHRIRMCELAASTSDWIRVDRWEADQPRFQRTLHVLQSIQRRYTLNEVAPDVRLVCGADLIQAMCDPGAWDQALLHELLSSFGLMVYARKGYDTHQALQCSPLLSSFVDTITWLPDDVENNISSSLVRRLRHEHRSIRYLTPDSVCHYVEQGDFYA